MIERRRFLVPDIEPGAAHLSAPEGIGQRGFVVDAAARRGNEVEMKWK